MEFLLLNGLLFGADLGSKEIKNNINFAQLLLLAGINSASLIVLQNILRNNSLQHLVYIAVLFIFCLKFSQFVSAERALGNKIPVNKAPVNKALVNKISAIALKFKDSARAVLRSKRLDALKVAFLVNQKQENFLNNVVFRNQHVVDRSSASRSCSFCC